MVRYVRELALLPPQSQCVEVKARLSFLQQVEAHVVIVVVSEIDFVGNYLPKVDDDAPVDLDCLSPLRIEVAVLLGRRGNRFLAPHHHPLVVVALIERAQGHRHPRKHRGKLDSQHLSPLANVADALALSVVPHDHVGVVLTKELHKLLEYADLGLCPFDVSEGPLRTEPGVVDSRRALLVEDGAVYPAVVSPCAQLCSFAVYTEVNCLLNEHAFAYRDLIQLVVWVAAGPCHDEHFNSNDSKPEDLIELSVNLCNRLELLLIRTLSDLFEATNLILRFVELHLILSSRCNEPVVFCLPDQLCLVYLSRCMLLTDR